MESIMQALLAYGKRKESTRKHVKEHHVGDPGFRRSYQDDPLSVHNVIKGNIEK
jgi:hypothetical protein